MFKLENNDTRATPSSVPIVNFKHVTAGLDKTTRTTPHTLINIMLCWTLYNLQSSDQRSPSLLT